MNDEYRHSSSHMYLAEESNLVLQFRSLLCSSITLARHWEREARIEERVMNLAPRRSLLTLQLHIPVHFADERRPAF